MKDSYEVFLDNIDKWINDFFLPLPVDKSRVDHILNKSPEELRSSNSEDLAIDCILLYKYIDGLQSLYNKEKSVLDFAESSILFISSKEIENYGDKYTKWELKYNAAVKQNPLALKLFKLALVSRARLTSVEKRIENIKKIADLINQISNSKKYERNS